MIDLNTLRPEVRMALEVCDRDLPETWHSQTTQWGVIRAELLRLENENTYIRGIIKDLRAAATEQRVRAVDAEAELAALKARIAESHVVVMSGHRICADTQEELALLGAAWICGVRRVRLVVEE